ncbi:Protein-glutamate methylesterase/protein-glutamine glutaminase 3 [Gammaproteobacteria bacterium]
MAKLKILVADDSPMMRMAIRSLLEDADDMEVIGEAGNGREAVRLAAELRPDLITMDVEMPVMNGIQAIGEIMSHQAVPILVVSNHNDAKTACGAIARGALEILSKSDLTPQTAPHFVNTLRRLARVPVTTRPRVAPPVAPPLRTPSRPAAMATFPASNRTPQIFAIASSTGGPQALAAILSRLPAEFPCPVVIAQHIAFGFANGLAEWLDGLCVPTVRLAREGEPLNPGNIYVSPSESHLKVTRVRHLSLASHGARDIYRPSCDQLLASVAEVYGHHAVGIILTGMGNDGAQGMERIFQAGGPTLAQDETSSVVFGMNRVAIDRGWIRKVLPIAAIGPEMCRLAGVAAI